MEVWQHSGRFGSTAVSSGRDPTDKTRHVASRVLQCFTAPPLQLWPDVSMLSEMVSLCFSQVNVGRCIAALRITVRKSEVVVAPC